MKHQFHFGKKFYLDKKTGYWISSKTPKIRAHVWVWKQFNGEIPKGYHIHHKDDNKSNNDISNLEMILASTHLSLHSSRPENRERMRSIADENRHLTKAWHSSDEGREWHRQHAIKCGFGNNVAKDYVCECCTKPFQSTKTGLSRFCSNACKSKWRRDARLDDIVKICPVCCLEFKVGKYSKTKACGRVCGGIFKSKEYRARRG